MKETKRGECAIVNRRSAPIVVVAIALFRVMAPEAGAVAEVVETRAVGPQCSNQVAAEPCWMPLANLPGCHLWLESDGFEHDASTVDRIEVMGDELECRSGRLTGNVRLDWTIRYNGDESYPVVRNGTYLDGLAHGSQSEIWPSGSSKSFEYEHGRPTGRWTQRSAEGAPTSLMDMADGRIATITLPRAKLPRATVPPSGKAPVDGGFGVDFGADLSQLSEMECDRWRLPATDCLQAFAGQLWRGPPPPEDWLTGLAIRRPARPLAGGREYYATVTARRGIEQIQAEFEFASADRCLREETRLNRLLEDKYESCKAGAVFDDIGAIRTRRPGQCDENGMPERSVWVSNCFEFEGRHQITIYYEVVDEWRRKRVAEAYGESIGPGIDEL